MLRPLSRNVAMYRLTYINSPVEHRFFVRFISSSSEPSEKSTTASKIPSPSIPEHVVPPRRVKLDPRPSPVKPKILPLSTTFAPTNPSPRPSPMPSLGVAKEVSKRDIEEAQGHGILIPPPAGASWLKRIMHKGIQLAKFYYRGVKLIFVRRTEVLAIKARIRAGGSSMTRHEYRLIATQRSDVRKVIPFIAIALLLEEIIPVIALYVPSMLPSTCILPSQRQRIEEKKAEKAIAFSTTYRPLFAQLRAQENSVGYLPFEVLQQSQASEAICGILRLTTIGIDVLRALLIKRHLAFITEDDRLLLCDNSPLAERDLNEALEERGMLIQGLTLQAKQVLLQWWLESVRDADINASSCRRLSLILAKHLEYQSM